MLHYRSLIHVGIEELDGRLPCQPFNKHHHHGGAVCCYSGMAVANQSPVPPGASLKGVGRGQCLRVLFNLADRPRKIITKLNVFYPLSNLQRPQNDGIALPPRIPLVTYPLYAPLCRGRLFLVGCCVLVRQ